MTIDKQKLKALAEAANAVTTDVNITMAVGADPEEVRSMQDFLQQAMPKKILALLAEIERLEAEGRGAKDAKVGLGWAVNELRSSFKNFHRSLCARFGYTHDEKDWFRDQASLEEHVAGQIDQLKAENEALRNSLGDCAASLEGEMLQKFGGQKPEDMHPVTRREYDRDMVELAGYRAAMAKEASHG